MTHLLSRLPFLLTAAGLHPALWGYHTTRGRSDPALDDLLDTPGQVRRALAESEARLRLALTAADVSTYEIDLGRGLIWLDRWTEVLSGGAPAVNGWLPINDPRVRDWFARLHPDDRPIRREALRAVIEGRTDTVALTYRFRDAAGQWRWLAERVAVGAQRPDGGGSHRILGVVRDATEQHDRSAALQREVAERTAALRESERRVRCLLDSVFLITGLLSRDGVLLAANRAALEFLGVAEQTALGRPVLDLDPWRSDPTAAESLRLCIERAAAGLLVRGEATLPDAAGGMRTFEFSLKPVTDEGGAVSLLIAEARDVTERHGLQAQLAQAQKMEAVGQLTGGVAHDFNNLLQTLTGNLDLIRRHAETHGDARLRQLAANAEAAASRGARLTQRLLAFSRRGSARREAVLVGRLVAEMAELLHRAAGETVRVESRATPDLWPCEVDPAQFESALLNLVINARDAMPQGGTVTITAANASLAEAEAMRLDVQPGAYVRVDVGDTGIGIAPAHLPHLFEPFFTTKPAGKGTGLGLAMVHGFARQSGGAVTVASAPGRGTVFSLFLPRAAVAARTETAARAAAPAPAPALPPAAVRTPASLRVLVVDDDAEVREAVQFVLADAGHRVVSVADAPAALAVLAGETPLDLLLCDVALPDGESGLDVAASARRLRPGLRILMVSGYGDALDRRDGFEVLAKPFSQAALLHCVAQREMPAAAD